MMYTNDVTEPLREISVRKPRSGTLGLPDLLLLGAVELCRAGILGPSVQDPEYPDRLLCLTGVCDILQDHVSRNIRGRAGALCFCKIGCRIYSLPGQGFSHLPHSRPCDRPWVEARLTARARRSTISTQIQFLMNEPFWFRGVVQQQCHDVLHTNCSIWLQSEDWKARAIDDGGENAWEGFGRRLELFWRDWGGLGWPATVWTGPANARGGEGVHD